MDGLRGAIQWSEQNNTFCVHDQGSISAIILSANVADWYLAKFASNHVLCPWNAFASSFIRLLNCDLPPAVYKHYTN